MAVTFVTDIENVSADLSIAYLVDLTTYGGGNPARNALALYLYLYKRDAQSNDTQISVDNSNPLTVTQWSFTLPSPDGIFVAVIFGFDIWQAGTYSNLDCVYYNGAYYRANTATSQTPGSGGNWTLITDILATCSGNATVEQSQTYNFSAARAEAGQLGDAMADLGNKIKDGKCKNWEEAAAVLTGAGLIESAWTNFRRGDYSNAQSIMDFVDAQTSLTI